MISPAAAIALAVGLAVVDSVCFGLAAVLQHRAVRRTVGRPTLDLRPLHEQLPDQHRHRLGFGHLGALIRRGGWLGGLGLILLGGSLHIVALILAPVSMIQPIGVLGVPVAVLASAALARVRPARRLAWPIAACVLAVATFVWLSSGQQDRALSAVGDLVLSEVVVVLLIGAFAVAARLLTGWARCVCSAVAGAVGLGLVSALVRGLADHLAAGRAQLFTPATAIMIGGIAVAGLAGGWLVQRAYASGPPEVVIACLTVVDPMVAVVIGFSVLGEGQALGPGIKVAMAGCALLATLGVIALARFHPEATNRRGSGAGDRSPVIDLDQDRTLVSADSYTSRATPGGGKEYP